MGYDLDANVKTKKMKKSSKLKLPAVIACILFLFATLYSCKKDNDQQENINGTTWSWRGSESRDDLLLVGSYPNDGNNFTYDLYCSLIIISFSNSGASVDIAFIAYIQELDAWTDSQKFYTLGPNASYTYKGKNINIKFGLEMLTFDFPEQIWTGTVNKNTMNLENVFGASVKLGKQ